MSAVLHNEASPKLRAEFSALAAEWKEKTRYLSNTTQMAMMPSYQRIIGLGPAVVPLILEELQKERRQWFWALRYIAGVNPVPPEDAGNVKAMAEAWIQWGRNEGFIDK